MIRQIFLFLFPFILLLSLGSCASMTPSAAKRAYCNMLKSNLIFNGSTSITREANIENSNTPLDQRSWDEANCDEEG